MESKPVRTIPVHEYLRPKLCDLYESDCIFDKFECCASGDGSAVMTGSYNNCFKIYDLARNNETTLELSKLRPKPPVVRSIPPLAGGGGPADGGDIVMGGAGGPTSPPDVDVEEIDYTKKVLHFSWHPSENIAAVAGLNNLYIYQA
jgi:serine/threonine-protein phosphatase 2A regulatory subunit B